MEIRKIEIDGKVLEYQLNRKNIKNCYLRVVSGRLVVTSGMNFNTSDIEKFIRKNYMSILKRIEKYTSKINYVDNGYVYIFDKKYTIYKKELRDSDILISDNKIFVDGNNFKETIETKLKEILIKYLIEKTQYYISTMFFLPMPLIEVKKYKSRWGACFYKKNLLKFNISLVHLNKQLIDYVIIHELCHFLHANHSNDFYLEIKKRMPDYKFREKQLKEIQI